MSKWLQAAKSHGTRADKTDFTDKTLPEDVREEVLSVVSVLSGGPLPTVQSAGSPVRELIEALQSDMDLYAEALRTHGSMSYGQAMDVLGWGATRAGQAETDLRDAGRIAFNNLGRAVLSSNSMERNQ
ncbi:hypothetical protein EFR00_30385 [Rhizobium sophoriradicis]|uniref:hypothetical protein n=1 Tax=Rhizobium sophoriradicis TaxID=1535245 RepID=UPI00098F9793|nr:hypothetical protein [Rhizobium sophoriradicis]RSB82456.1 hypothetical protein EFR00_30385 [Rhizobium sophoriradicis]